MLTLHGSLLLGFQLLKNRFFLPLFLYFFFILFDNQMVLLISRYPVQLKLDIEP